MAAHPHIRMEVEEFGADICATTLTSRNSQANISGVWQPHGAWRSGARVHPRAPAAR